MSGDRAAGIALLSDLQAQAYANHEGWRYQLDRERDERMRQLNAWRMSEIQALDRVMHPVAGVDSAPVVKEMLDAANEPAPPVDIPTPFQNPNDYRILDALRLRIANTADRTKVEVPATITLGTLPMGDVEARTWPVKGTDEYVIVVREGVLSFVHVLGKVLLSAMDVTQPDGTTRFTADLAAVATNVAAKPEIVADFDALLDACFTQGNAWHAPHRYLPPAYDEPLRTLLDSGELFVLCHELAHVKLAHFKPDPDRKTRAAARGVGEGIYCEFEADHVGMHDTLAVMGANFGGWVREAASGIPLLLTGLDLYERARAHYAGAEPARPDPTHPAYADRRAAIYAVWAGYDMADELLRGAAVIDGVLGIIWEAFAKRRPPLAETQT